MGYLEYSYAMASSAVLCSIVLQTDFAVFRQTDSNFVKVLNDIRYGVCSKEVYAAMRQAEKTVLVVNIHTHRIGTQTPTPMHYSIAAAHIICLCTE